MPTSRKVKNSVTNGKEYKVSAEGRQRLGKLILDLINLNKLINSKTLTIKKRNRI
jgi:hypothetical protein